MEQERSLRELVVVGGWAGNPWGTGTDEEDRRWWQIKISRRLALDCGGGTLGFPQAL